METGFAVLSFRDFVCRREVHSSANVFIELLGLKNSSKYRIVVEDHFARTFPRLHIHLCTKGSIFGKRLVQNVASERKGNYLSIRDTGTRIVAFELNCLDLFVPMNKLCSCKRGVTASAIICMQMVRFM